MRGAMPSGQLLHQRLLPRHQSTREESTIRHYFLRFLIRFRSSFMDIVGWFLLSSTSFQKFEDVCSATSSQSFPSTPTITAAGLPRRVITIRSCCDTSTHCFIFFCKSRAFTVFIKYPLFWFPSNVTAISRAYA
jgi:hypothetical protein